MKASVFVGISLDVVAKFPAWPYGKKPVLVLSTRPLGGVPDRDIRLRHLATRHFVSGLVQSEYEVAV